MSTNSAPSLQAVVDSLAGHGERTALLAFTKRGQERWTYGTLAERVRAFAHGLSKAGFKPGDAGALFAEERPELVAAALGVLRAGGVVVPLDVQLGDDDLAHVLSDSAARVVITAARRVARLEKLDLKEKPRLIVFDAGLEDERSWLRLLDKEKTELPMVTAADAAVLFYTSGTTGPPKGVPLSHGNIRSQLEVVAGLGVVTGADRILLPLPLHHVYPFVIGMLVPLFLGGPVIFPASRSGQQLLRAIREGEVTAIVGVPRLYGALHAGITARVAASGRVTRRVFGGLSALSALCQRWLGWRGGKTFFRSLHARFGATLRLLASGGSALDPVLATQLEALGWQVAIGYGLTETSPLLSINLPKEWRTGSVGRPFPGVEIRIDPTALDPAQSKDDNEIGEIQARGPNVFAGYRNLPEQTREAFTPDGWFRTGDIGYFDREQFLYVIGRLSTLIKTESGEKIQAEDVETAYAAEAAIGEIGVLEKSGRLVALIVPERTACGNEIEAAVRAAIAGASRRLRSYERISDYAITPDALPRTRLGKIQRHRLAERFETAKNTGATTAPAGAMPVEEMSGEDRSFLEDPAAHTAWELLARRHPEKRLTPDTNLQFDLAIDSLEWLNLTLEIAEGSGVEITDEAIARIDTVRDLLREVTEAGEGAGIDPLAQPYAILNETQRRWLKPLGPLMNLTARSIYACGRVLMRLLFRVHIEGRENLPDDRPWVMTPNHLSHLDAFVLANALNWKQLRNTYWAGWTEVVAPNAFMRFLSRLGRILPVEPSRAARSALALGAIVLQNGRNLVWFPEGGLSRGAGLQTFKPGIGLLLEKFQTAVIPVSIHGTDEALPPGRHFPRLRPVRIVIGKAQTTDELMRVGQGGKPHERIAGALQEKVRELSLPLAAPD